MNMTGRQKRQWEDASTTSSDSRGLIQPCRHGRLEISPHRLAAAPGARRWVDSPFSQGRVVFLAPLPFLWGLVREGNYKVWSELCQGKFLGKYTQPALLQCVQATSSPLTEFRAELATSRPLWLNRVVHALCGSDLLKACIQPWVSQQEWSNPQDLSSQKLGYVTKVKITFGRGRQPTSSGCNIC